MNCPKCSGPMKLVPAGTSKKTGKPYNAFWSCKKWECGGTAKLEGEAPQEAKFERTDAFKSQNQISDNIKRFESAKEENMKIMASGRDAVLITVAEMNQGNAWSEEDVKKRIQMWAKWIKTSIYSVPFVG